MSNAEEDKHQQRAVEESCQYEMCEDNVYTELKKLDSKNIYATPSAVNLSKDKKASSKTFIYGRKMLICFLLVIILIAIAMVVFVIMVMSDIVKLKSEVASLDHKIQAEHAIKFSLGELQANISLQNSSLRELQADLNSSFTGSLRELQADLNSNFTGSLRELQTNLNSFAEDLQQNIRDLRNDIEVLAYNISSSCAAILALVHSSSSGYYWIRSSNGSAVRVYCDMTRSCGGVTGGWMRVAELDMTNSSSQCPSGLRQRSDSNIRTCDSDNSDAGCSSVIFTTGLVAYSRLCGRIQGYQYSSTNAFGRRGGSNQDINTPYVDGVSLTHGSPRQHIWTFAAAAGETDNPDYNCPCTNVNEVNRVAPRPAFVENDYFCDTGSEQNHTNRFYSEDPLWDGAGCGPLSTCCSFNNPPWLYKQLPFPTTDNIEMRVCRDQSRGNEDVAIASYEIYVQ